MQKIVIGTELITFNNLFKFLNCMATEVIAYPCNSSQLAELVSTMHPQLVRTAIRRDVRPADAEDIAQNTWLKIYTMWAQNNNEGFRAPPKKLVYSILGQQVIEYRRLRKARYGHVSLSPETESISDGRRNPLETLVERDACNVLDNAIRQLDHEEQFVIQLVDVYGLSYAHAAYVLSTTPNKINTKLSRARRRLRTRLASYHPNAA